MNCSRIAIDAHAQLEVWPLSVCYLTQNLLWNTTSDMKWAKVWTNRQMKKIMPLEVIG